MIPSRHGCPRELVTDLGTENKIMVSAQAFFRDDENAHTHVASPRNQRIEVIGHNTDETGQLGG